MDYINDTISRKEMFYWKVSSTLDYYFTKKAHEKAHKQIKQYFKDNIFEDLMKNRFHPKNIEKFEAWGFDE